MIEKNILISLYLEERMSYIDIASELKTSKGQVGYWIKKYGITCRPRSQNLKDMTGKTYGKFTVIRKVKNEKGTTAKWLCKCDCGKEKEILRTSLVSGATRSCGCLHRESCFKGHNDLSKSYWNRIQKGAQKRNLEFNITIEYIWDLYIKQGKRCNLSDLDILIVTNYTKEHHLHTASLDRIDNNQGYIVGNVQWVHRDINIMKKTHSEDYFIELCHAVAETRKDNE